MALFKEKPTYVFRKGKYYNVNSNEIRGSLTKKEKESFTIINLPDTKQHLTKYDKKNKYKYKIVKDKVEYGISTNEVDILYLVDYLYLINNLEYKNILLRTEYFSIVLINNITIDFIEHSKEEGEDLQFFSMLFNNSEFVHADLFDLYNKIVNDKSENNLVSVVFLLLLGLGVYYGVIHEEEEEVFEEEEAYVIEDNAIRGGLSGSGRAKTYRLQTDQQKEILKHFRQRSFFNELISFAQDEKVKNMFKMITKIKADGKNEKYSFTMYSLLPDLGFKRAGDMFRKSVKFDRYDTDKGYENKLNQDIIKNEAKYVDFFLSNSKLHENFYTKRIRDYLVKNELEYRLEDLDPNLVSAETSLQIRKITNDTKIKYLKEEFGFIIEEITKETSTLVLNKGVEADKVFRLIRYLRDVNILVDKMDISKIQKTVNSTMFKVKCQITIKNKG